MCKTRQIQDRGRRKNAYIQIAYNGSAADRSIR